MVHKTIDIFFKYFDKNLKFKNIQEMQLVFDKYITHHAASEKTPPQSSWPITTLATLAEWRQNVWVVACAGARIYHTATKYMRIIYL